MTQATAAVSVCLVALPFALLLLLLQASLDIPMLHSDNLFDRQIWTRHGVTPPVLLGPDFEDGVRIHKEAT